MFAEGAAHTLVRAQTRAEIEIRPNAEEKRETPQLSFQPQIATVFTRKTPKANRNATAIAGWRNLPKTWPHFWGDGRFPGKFPWELPEKLGPAPGRAT